MALNRRLIEVSFPANGDLSASQYRACHLDSNGRVNISGTGNGTATPFLGILLNKPAATDRGADVAINGSICKMEAGAAIVVGDRIVAVAGGRGSPAVVGGTAFIVGYAVSPAAASASLFELEVLTQMMIRY